MSIIDSVVNGESNQSTHYVQQSNVDVHFQPHISCWRKD